MPLDYTHQMTILRDILQDHHTDCNGTASECAQLERLAAQLIAQESISSDVKDALSYITTYSHDGSTHQNLSQHITDHKEHIENWLQTIDGTSL
ncbi:hypothetical protein A374_09723 [Fictibacillus macauensis ZFHKF-1]|uniref:YtzH-like protein n=2 Tax=Fictibacillus TaxID=1329200 RepID=I8J1A7_9BACL|nr:hypothetical protein A374_09723 [Fictibacillus macauensis ZFHKF-1]